MSYEYPDLDTPVVKTFNAPGVLEHVLSFADTNGLLLAACVSRRWRAASRVDSIWRAIICREALTFLTKYDCDLSDDHVIYCDDDKDDLPLFWRSLFTESAVLHMMTAKQIRSIVDHPLVNQTAADKGMVRKDATVLLPELRAALQQHMLNVWSSNQGSSLLFSDLYFGSYACMIRDSRRQLIQIKELTFHSGFDMYFKASESELVEPSDVENMIPFEDHPGIFLQFHSGCHFRENFVFEAEQPVYNRHLPWRWLEGGQRIQVGHYPPLTVSRRTNWGWKLENIYVVLFERNGQRLKS